MNKWTSCLDKTRDKLNNQTMPDMSSTVQKNVWTTILWHKNQNCFEMQTNQPLCKIIFTAHVSPSIIIFLLAGCRRWIFCRTHITEVICINYNKSTALAVQTSIIFWIRSYWKSLNKKTGFVRLWMHNISYDKVQQCIKRSCITSHNEMLILDL
jgi:hypothetical protein